MTTVAVIGAGAMGAAIAARLVSRGCNVPTLLAGRGAATRARAIEAGMFDADPRDLVAAPIILSIVPPAAAGAVVDALAPALSSARRKPLLVDCNPLSPTSKRALGARVAALGCTLVHGALIGAPPRQGEAGPRLYVSGPGADGVARLADLGLDVRVLQGAPEAADAVKMCYAALNKGLIALTTLALLAAEKANVSDVLIAEFSDSQEWLLERARRSIPTMYPKAYRWDAEMDEIATFLAEDISSAGVFHHLAQFFADRAAAQADGGREPARMRQLLGLPS